MRRVLILAIVLAACLVAGCGGVEDETQAVIEDSPTPTVEAPIVVPTESVTAAGGEETPEPTPTNAPQVTADRVEIVETAETVEPVVFNDDFATSVAPIFADHCASCHNAGGPGSVHWRLDTAADLASTHSWLSTVVEIG